MRRQAHALQQLETLLARRRFVTIENLNLRQRQVVDNRQVREQFKMLKHHSDVRAQFGKIGLFIVNHGAIDDNLPLLHRLKAVHGFNQRGFTGA